LMGPDDTVSSASSSPGCNDSSVKPSKMEDQNDHLLAQADCMSGPVMSMRPSLALARASRRITRAVTNDMPELQARLLEIQEIQANAAAMQSKRQSMRGGEPSVFASPAARPPRLSVAALPDGRPLLPPPVALDLASSRSPETPVSLQGAQILVPDPIPDASNTDAEEDEPDRKVRRRFSGSASVFENRPAVPPPEARKGVPVPKPAVRNNRAPSRATTSRPIPTTASRTSKGKVVPKPGWRVVGRASSASSSNSSHRPLVVAPPKPACLKDLTNRKRNRVDPQEVAAQKAAYPARAAAKVVRKEEVACNPSRIPAPVHPPRRAAPQVPVVARAPMVAPVPKPSPQPSLREEMDIMKAQNAALQRQVAELAAQLQRCRPDA
jgi:hypothetical protein